MDNIDFSKNNSDELIKAYTLLKDFLKYLASEEENNKEDDKK